MMHKTKNRLRKLRLTVLFTAMIFFIILFTDIVTLSGMALLHTSGLLKYQNPAWLLGMFAFSCLLIGTITAIIASRRPLRPVQEIMDAADRIADGDYSVRLALKGPEEMRQLCEKFNHMAEELGSVELLRKDFINNFSHEFKTPIVSIRGFAKMLKLETLTGEERNEYLDTIISESERLADLAASVLNLSKIEQQSILTDKNRFNVSEQIRRCIVLLEGKWSKKDIGFDLNCKEYYLTGNEKLLEQVWINLLDNAVKFSPVGGIVSVEITQKEGFLVFVIADQGSGIEENAIPHIFDKFYQAYTSHATVGNGLGLAIVKR
ncbi:MAG: HAMP domain-containing histidine kinase, partial [Muribaculum sp.]|nr:HAMP domain-containing histidine kinase [Muribaculum sp.]